MIFHITSRKDWETAQSKGEYRAESLQTEGFIHCSTLAQVLPVAEKFYKGQSGLVLLVIEPTLLSSTLKWEPPSGGAPPPGVPEGDPFPHVYGPIDLDAVVNVVDFIFDSNGTFQMPEF
ncbi:MAG: DUF952 domain-containing protein [Anaerolineales bacterium]|nr:DUF952 domain-containing protein [Anaerolineae bacterium]PWB71109.1 MAG: DUF952 domain-containing protein [Anaerolineales bacterium]